MPGSEVRPCSSSHARRHSVLVRLTHWVHAAALFALIISGFAILVAHPRLYWGETGAVGMASLIDLPLPFILDGRSGWGRSLHFLSAWVYVLTGALYVVSGLFTQHFRRNLLPTRKELKWRAILRSLTTHIRLKRTEAEFMRYNPLQQVSYLVVIFVVSPLAVASGLAMSPAITSVIPRLVNCMGGQQSARSIHFFVACSLVLFTAVHIVIVCLSGFMTRIRAITWGNQLAGGKNP